MAKKSKKLFGVYRRKYNKHYEARAVVNKKLHHIGSFLTDRDAALAHDLFLINNHPNPENCSLNMPNLLRISNLPKMPKPAGQPLESPREKRKPLSRTGERFIHREHYGFVFRISKVVDGKREYHRVKCDTLPKAVAARNAYLRRA